MSVHSGRPEPNLVTESVASGYGGGLIVRGVSIQAGPGEIVTIIGPNGSGKSTLLKTIAGLVPGREGRILHRGADVSRDAPEQRARERHRLRPPGARGLRVADGAREPDDGRLQPVAQAARRGARARVLALRRPAAAREGLRRAPLRRGAQDAGDGARDDGLAQRRAARRADIEPGSDPERAPARARHSGARRDGRDRDLGRAASGAGDRPPRAGSTCSSPDRSRRRAAGSRSATAATSAACSSASPAAATATPTAPTPRSSRPGPVAGQAAAISPIGSGEIPRWRHRRCG